jgi:hypothetical protein
LSKDDAVTCQQWKHNNSNRYKAIHETSVHVGSPCNGIDGEGRGNPEILLNLVNPEILSKSFTGFQD